jgi:hypothetical protein
MKNLFSENRLVMMNSPERPSESKESDPVLNTEKLYTSFLDYMAEGNNQNKLAKCGTSGACQRRLIGKFIKKHVKRLKESGGYKNERQVKSKMRNLVREVHGKFINDIKRGKIEKKLERSREYIKMLYAEVAKKLKKALKNRIVDYVKKYGGGVSKGNVAEKDKFKKTYTKLPRVRKAVNSYFAKLASRGVKINASIAGKSTPNVKIVIVDISPMITGNENLNKKRMQAIASRLDSYIKSKLTA